MFLPFGQFFSHPFFTRTHLQIPHGRKDNNTGNYQSYLHFPKKQTATPTPSRRTTTPRRPDAARSIRRLAAQAPPAATAASPPRTPPAASRHRCPEQRRRISNWQRPPGRTPRTRSPRADHWRRSALDHRLHARCPRSWQSNLDSSETQVCCEIQTEMVNLVPLLCYICWLERMTFLHY